MIASSIKVMVGTEVVGVVQSLEVDDCCPIAISSSREIIEREPFPRVTTTRIRFDKLRVAEAFSRGVFNAKAQRYPFNIEVEDDEEITIIKNCWLTDNNRTWTTDDYVISEGTELIAEGVSSKKK